jgi:DNA-directed RNA polymerase subunit K/omega
MMAWSGSADSPYFVNTPNSVAVPLTDIAVRETPDPERVKRALQLMMDAKDGKREKRKPIEVMKTKNGKYRVIDGNTTLQALKELDETTAVVTIRNGNKSG